MKEIILIFIWLLSVNYCGKSQKLIDVDSISIEYINMDIDTPFSIHCDNFEAFFQEDIEMTIIRDSITIMK